MKNPEKTDGGCEILPWDTGFFGLRIARLNSERLTPALVSAADSWCLTNRIRCLYFLACADDPETSSLAEENGFRLVDLRMTFEITPGKVPHTTSVRPAVPPDFERLAALAGANSGESRFAFDRRFPPDAARRLYERWMEQSCGGMAAAVFVAGPPGEPVGYVTCELDAGSGVGKIGLLGLAPEARGRGIAQQLLAHALGWFESVGCARVTVVTQGRNIAAQRLYQRAGFLSRQVQLSYHKWHPQHP